MTAERHGDLVKLLFSVTRGDCEWKYTRGTGSGGQKRNKTASAVHCTHKTSGAHGYAEDSRSQSQNRATAFGRMARSDKFQAWHRLETAKRTGAAAEAQRTVEQQMKNVRVEVQENGRWVEERLP